MTNKTVRRLSYASLDCAIGDPIDRNILSMSTIVTSDQFMAETTWDGSTIGDVQIFINKACGPNGLRLEDPILDADGRPAKGPDGKALPHVPRPDDWRWWAGVPRARIKMYRFVDTDGFSPGTVDSEPLKTIPHAQRQEESRQAGAKGAKGP